MEARQFKGVMRRKVRDCEKWIEKEARESHGVLLGRCLWKEHGAPGCTSLIQEPDQEDTRRYVCGRAQKQAMQREEIGRNRSGWCWKGDQNPWDIRAAEEGNDVKYRWSRENGMAVEGVRLMAEGNMVGWNELAELDDATMQVLGNMWRKGEEKWKKGRRRNRGSRINDWGVLSWAQEVPLVRWVEEAARQRSSSRPWIKKSCWNSTQRTW